MLKAPNFWYNGSRLGALLKPLAFIYSQIVKFKNSRVKPQKLEVPVICVGNLVMGGAGKTPTVIEIAKILSAMGQTPHIISRGYGGYLNNVTKVNLDMHNYVQVGDEPLLLARHFPVWIGANKILSAKEAIKNGATVLVLDDGLQNPIIYKDINIVVVDAMQGVGNGLVFPAGPMREPIANGLKKADAVLLIGSSDDFKPIAALDDFSTKYRGFFKASLDDTTKEVVAFAGLGYPQKFYKTLQENGFVVKKFIEFADHHPYTIVEIEHLLKIAKDYGCRLITTEKDLFRIPKMYKNQITTLPITVDIVDANSFVNFIKTRLQAK